MRSEQTFLGKPVVASITTFDRLIFKGHLPGLAYPAAVMGTLATFGQVLLKNWKAIVEPLSARIKDHLEQQCRDSNRPFIYLSSAHTHRDAQSKEAIARNIAKSRDITEGLVCVLRVLEPASSFDVRGNRDTHRLEIVRRRRRCLHYYVYLIDREFGWMHVRIQGWLPFTVQVYVNGREWTCRQLDKRGVGYRRSDNKIIDVDDMNALARATRRLERMNWPRVLDRWAKAVNPLLPKLTDGDRNRGYYWVTDQCEYATDLLFKDRRTVEELMPDLRSHAHVSLSVRDCFRFLGKRPSKAEAIVDIKRRPEGWRIKFRVGRNSVKVYDHANIIRFETTINHPGAFRVVRHEDMTASVGNSGTQAIKPKKKPVRKGVRDFWLLARIAGGCNQRMIASCDSIRTTQAAIDDLDTLARPKTVRGRHVARINAVDPETINLFKAIADGANCMNGFSNRDLQTRLYAKPTNDFKEKRRRISRIGRRITCMRGHGLIAKIPNANRYRITRRGMSVIHAVIRFHDLEYPMPIAA
jgi:hypothetical protein